MFRSFYGLSQDPFPKDLDTKHGFQSKDFREGLQRLPNLFKSVYIPISTLTVMDFYRALCNGLGILPTHKMVGMFKQIQESIYTYYHSKNITPVIIIDEVQFLKNAVLDDLRLLFNFDMDSKDYAILILSGQTSFISQISRQPHEALRQRIVVNYCLQGLQKQEVKEYVQSRLKLAGCHEPIFTEDALELLFTSTNGHIRPLNTLAKMSLISRANQNLQSINSEIIYQAQNELNITM